MNDYFSDREFGSKPMVVETIDQNVWRAITALIKSRVDDGSLAHGFPLPCPDGNAIIGTNSQTMAMIIRSEIKDLVDDDNESLLYSWNPEPGCNPPGTLAVLDLVELVAKNVACPQRVRWHDFFSHYHLNLDRDEGLQKFVNDINRLFSRNGLAYRLTEGGTIERTLLAPMAEMLRRARFSTGDEELDRLLCIAIERSLEPKSESRQDALEKLWDAFERLKTLESSRNKKEGAQLLINRAVGDDSPVFHAAVTKEFHELTDLGNRMRIRHSEVGKEPVGDNGEKDYLMWRMFSLIWFMLKATGRLSEAHNGRSDVDAPF